MVIISFALLGSSDQQAVVLVRLIRLGRLITVVKGIKELRVIVVGLIEGLGSVQHILLLLTMVIYLFAVLGRTLFGKNE